MTEDDRMAAAASGPLPWAPSKLALWRGRIEDPDGARATTVYLQHPLDPYRYVLDDAADESLQKAAYDYLLAALAYSSIKELRIPPDWLDSLKPGSPESAFGWMLVLWPNEEEITEPCGSFRNGPETGNHLVALFASQRGGKQFLGSGFGLSIVLRMRRLASGRFQAAIVGFSGSLPFGPYAMATTKITESLKILSPEFLLKLKPQLQVLTQLDTVFLRGVRVGAPGRAKVPFELRGVGFSTTAGNASGPAYAFTVRGEVAGPDTALSKASLIYRSALVADAAVPGHGDVFESDPQSQGDPDKMRDRRPTRDDADLQPFRCNDQITTGLFKPLDDGKGYQVVPCAGFVAADDGAAPPRMARLPGVGPAIRSDDASAVQGLFHVRDLFARLEAYHLPVAEYFRIAQPTIDIAYRSGISPGPGKDGRSVNARVAPEGWAADFIGPTPFGQRPTLRLHLALGNLSRRARERWMPGGNPVPAQPLGIGADARWMWHEFGHVLLMATTGELEFRFAHSPGDALAAIVSDPMSNLRSQPKKRFATFPWVFVPRRHDRYPHHGWGWNGPMHAPLARVADSEQPRMKGYLSEQILSSSLFRLYRCLGGDTAADIILNDNGDFERRRASHYSLYLIMYALKLLGDSGAVLANEPEQLVLKLIEADTATFAWDVKTTTYKRSGGCAHKAIRWAFEVQGLYAPTGASPFEPGAPPSVDVYVASRRKTVDSQLDDGIDYEPGSYVPVSLHWSDKNGPVPEWQASAISVEADGVHVEVGNRGQQSAQGVEVSVWWAALPASHVAPAWPDAAWAQALPASSAPKNIGARKTRSFGPFVVAAPAGADYVVLARATCVADRSNIDPSTGFECTLTPTPVIDIVANDNNLGLLVVWA